MKNNAPEWATHVASNVNLPYTTYAKKWDKHHDFGVYIGQDGYVFGEDWTFEPIEKTESIYTQEMKDNGERVKVGMKFKVGCSIYTAGLVSDGTVACVQDGRMLTFDLDYIEPIVSEREEAEAKQIEDCFSEYIKGQPALPPVTCKSIKTSLKRLQKAGLLAEIILPLKRS